MVYVIPGAVHRQLVAAHSPDALETGPILAACRSIWRYRLRTAGIPLRWLAANCRE
jgi:hypothetical protein